MMQDPAANPVGALLRDLQRVVQGMLPVSQVWQVEMQLQPSDIILPWRMSLHHGVEAVLAGDLVIREHIRAKLSLTDGELLDWFELLTHATHQLIRFYALGYCTTCRAQHVTAAAVAGADPR